MIYVERDHLGKISAIHHAQKTNAVEQKSLFDDELLEFLGGKESHALINLLSLSDSNIIRIIEDLIELLINKNIILFTELPEAAQLKIHERRQIRQRMDSDNIMVEDIL
jgi:hypothetical protein